MAAPSRSKGLILKSVDGISAQIVGRVCDLVTSTAFHVVLLVSCVTYVRELRVEISQLEYLLIVVRIQYRETKIRLCDDHTIYRD